MASVLFVAPLLAAHLISHGHSREIRAHGVVVRASATEQGGTTRAELDVTVHGKTQHIALESRERNALGLLTSIEILDANFDGAPDVSVAREIFLWDGHRFTSDLPLARELSRLESATFDARSRTITTRVLGPSNPSRFTYSIDRGALREIASCRFINPIDPNVGTLVRTRGEHATYTKTRLAPGEGDPCSTY